MNPPQSESNPPSPDFRHGKPADLEASILIPDHELLRCVGSGSYGEVWLARNMMGTFRAVKIVFRKAFRDHHPFDRELTGIRKFEPISRSHEGFVDVLQIGRNDDAGYFYYIMELGDDESSGQEIDPASYSPKTLSKEISLRGKLPVDECVELGATLCGALRHLHDQGLIHRDVKPSNIIFVHGTPKLADIGLVADIGEARSFVGTDGFIPPEGPNSFSADLYSLGKVLYEACTGFDRNFFPEMPADLNQLHDSTGLMELNEVLSKACLGQLGQRYQTASEMQADLAVLQSGRSVHRLRVLERRWSKAKRVTTVAGVALFVAALVIFQINRRQKQQAEQRQRQVGAQVAYGIQNMSAGDFTGALPYFIEALRLDPKDEAREAIHRVRLKALIDRCPKLSRMWFLEARVNDLRLSRDGSGLLVSPLLGRARLLGMDKKTPDGGEFGPASGVLAAALSPDGHIALTASANWVAELWDTKTGAKIAGFPHPDWVRDVAFSPDGKRFITACGDGKVRLWELGGALPSLTLSENAKAVLHAEFSPDGKWLVAAGEDNTARLWNVSTGERVGPPMAHDQWVYSASFSPDGKFLVTASYNRKARMWSVPEGKPFGIAMEHSEGVKSARFSPDGQYIVTAGFDSTVRIWDSKSGAPVRQNAILRHNSPVVVAAFNPDGRQIITGCVNGTIRVWDLAGGLATPRALDGVASPDGLLWALVTNNVIRVAATSPGGAQRPLITCPSRVLQTGFSRTGSHLLAICATINAAGQTNKSIGVWNTSTGQPVSPMIPFSRSLLDTCLSDDGRKLALFDKTTLHVINLPGSDESWPPLSHTKVVAGAAFDHAGNLLATFADNQVFVWDLHTGKTEFPPLTLDAQVNSVEFNPKGDLFVTSITDLQINERCAQLWDAKTGKPVGQPLWHHDGVLGASFSPDGERVVTSSEDFSAIVWNIRTSEPATRPLLSENQVFSSSFSADNRWVATASSDRSARLWDAQTGDPLTPAFIHPSGLSRAVIVGRDERLVATGFEGATWVWELPRESQSIEDLDLLAQLLLGDPRPAKRVTAAETTRLLASAWNRLTVTHPENFAVGTDQIIAWHQNEAGVARNNEDRFAESFHLRWLKEHARSNSP